MLLIIYKTVYNIFIYLCNMELKYLDTKNQSQVIPLHNKIVEFWYVHNDTLHLRYEGHRNDVSLKIPCAKVLNYEAVYTYLVSKYPNQ